MARSFYPTILNPELMKRLGLPGGDDDGKSKKKDYKIDSASVITLIGSWGSFKFYIKKKSIIGVKDITITYSNETETNSTNSKENYTSIKNVNPAEISMTGIFSRALGITDVRASCWKLMEIIRKGQKFYVYTGADKILAPLFVATNAKCSKIEIGPDKKWSYCEVQITLKQCEKYEGGTSGTIAKSSDSDGGGSSGGGGGGGGGGSGSKGKRSSGKDPKKKGKGLMKKKKKALDDTKKKRIGGAAGSIKKKLDGGGKTEKKSIWDGLK